MSDRLAREIAELEALDSAALRAAWVETFGRPPPKRMSRDMLLRTLAYHIQEQAFGGLSKAARRRLAALADPKDNCLSKPAPSVARPRPGTRLIREWRGQVHQVTVLEKGFDYQGEHCASLSQIARMITGTRWSGPKFFGLREVPANSGGAANGR